MAKSTSNKNKKPANHGKIEGIFVCTKCGTEYDNQEKNFMSSQSPLYAANNKRITVCNKCIEEIYSDYLLETDNEYDAMRRICMKFDMFFTEKINIVDDPNAHISDKVRSYVSKLSLKQNKDKTYDDTIREQLNKVWNEEEAEKAREKLKLTHEIVERWGPGYSKDEYEMAEKRYNNLLEQSDDDIDEIEKTLLKDLVNAEILKARAMKEGDVDRYDKCSKLYKNTLKETNLKNRRETKEKSSSEDSWGGFIRKVEEFAPAELYKKKSLFQDVDKLGEYYNRFIVRPFSNFFTGQKEMDPEFSISGDE